LRAAREAAPDGVAVKTVGPTGLTHREPFLIATRGGRTAVYGRVTPSGARGLVDAIADELLEPPAVAVGTVDEGRLPRPSDGPLAVGARRTLGRCGWVDPTDGSAIGTTAAAALESLASDTGFRERGRADGAGEPVVKTWDAVRTAESDPTVVVDGTEIDPNADADRLLLEADPGAVVDAAGAVADVIGGSGLVVVTGEDDGVARRRVESVAADADRDVTVAVEPGGFETGGPDQSARTVGEEQAAVVHTPRTLVGLRSLVHGADGSGDTGGGVVVPGATDDPGTRLVTVCGDAGRATVELPTDAPLSTALDAVGEPTFEFACVGGQFGGLTRTLDVPTNADALTAAGLGTTGVVELFDDSRCPVAVVGKRTKFARERGCGHCDGCQEVVPALHEQLREVYDGVFSPNDLRETCETLAGMDCRVAAGAARPTLSALDEFEGSFRAHADGRCPAGECY